MDIPDEVVRDALVQLLGMSSACKVCDFFFLIFYSRCSESSDPYSLQQGKGTFQLKPTI